MDGVRRAAVAMTLILAGRSMTLAFIGRAGDGGPGDPPGPWLMPLVGDAVIGLTALVVAAALWRRPTPRVWLGAVVWNALGAFDALAAYLVELRSPWPEFFMLEVFGRSMFFAAVAAHGLVLYLLTRPRLLDEFGLPSSGRSTQR